MNDGLSPGADLERLAVCRKRSVAGIRFGDGVRVVACRAWILPPEFAQLLHNITVALHSLGKLVRIAGLEPAHLSALPPQSSVSANSTICANRHFSEEIEAFSPTIYNQKPPVLTPVLTGTLKRRGGKRFQRVSKGLYRFKKTGTLYAVFKVDGKTRWKCLETDDPIQARERMAEEIKKSTRIDWRQAATVTVSQLLEMYAKNPMGLAKSTLKIRKQLLQVFERTWEFGLGIRASVVKPIMLKSWLATRKLEQSLKASGLNNYIRMLHGLFQLAVELGAVVESE